MATCQWAMVMNSILKPGEIPIRIVHGRYDMVCPPIFAYDLYQKLDNAMLYFVNAGHVASEPEIEEKLVESLREIAKLLE